jgi:hypothetical protein
MPYKSKQQSGGESKGGPAGSGQTKGDPNSTPINQDELTKRLEDEYTNDGLDDIPAHLINNPNRNLDKPDLDKPPYS